MAKCFVNLILPIDPLVVSAEISVVGPAGTPLVLTAPVDGSKVFFTATPGAALSATTIVADAAGTKSIPSSPATFTVPTDIAPGQPQPPGIGVESMTDDPSLPVVS